MVFEDATLRHGETLSQIVSDYGYNSWDWKIIWDHHKNSDLKNKRQKPENLLVGDIIIIPLPWKIISKNMSIYPNNSNRFGITVNRDGAKGNKLRWVQTIFGDNQSMHPTPFGVDFPDDDDPFYYTTNEIKNNSNYRKTFYDAPSRDPPLIRTTAWRAVLSICSISDLRVSVFESIVWGVDFGKNGINTKYLPRKATQQEISGHLRLLKIGKGKTKTFKDGGWTFREAPIY